MGTIKRAMLAALLLLGLTAVPVQATLVGEVQDHGLSYKLTIDGSGLNYVAVLTIVASGSIDLLPENQYISAVNFKVTNDIDSVTLTKAPGGTWETVEASLSTKKLCGVDGSGSGYVCSEATLVPISLSTSVPLRWEWDLTLTQGSQLFPDLIGAHIGAKYDNAEGTLMGLITSKEVAAPVPEPSALLLLGSGLLGLGGFAWRRNRKG